MKKVLFLITKSNWGGAQKYVYEMATAAHRAGADVAVAYGQPGILAEKLHEAHIQTHALIYMQRDAAFITDVRALREIYLLLTQERPDILHLNSSKAGFLGAVAGRAAGVPRIIFTAHGWPFKEDRNILSRAFLWLLSWLTALCAHRVIAVSDSELRLARRMPFCSTKAMRIYNGIDLHMPFGSGDVIRRAFPPGVHITGTVGELTNNKNQIALIEEARATPDMYVAIVGEGELRGMLEQKIHEYRLQDRVKLFGFMPAADVLKGFDTFALPSKKEALAFAILEARAAGLPIVANRIGGIPEAMDTPLSEFSLEHMVQKTLALYDHLSYEH